MVQKNELFFTYLTIAGEDKLWYSFYNSVIYLLRKENLGGYNMKYNIEDVNVDKVREDAIELFKKGFFCSEAILESIRTNFQTDLPEEVVKMASGFPVGIGRSKCICGAVSGGVMSLGLFFGRSSPEDKQVERTMALTKELHDYFKNNNGKNSLCCRVLTKEFDMSKGEHKEQCYYFTGLVAEKTARMICEELQKEEREHE